MRAEGVAQGEGGLVPRVTPRPPDRGPGERGVEMEVEVETPSRGVRQNGEEEEGPQRRGRRTRRRRRASWTPTSSDSSEGEEESERNDNTHSHTRPSLTRGGGVGVLSDERGRKRARTPDSATREGSRERGRWWGESGLGEERSRERKRRNVDLSDDSDRGVCLCSFTELFPPSLPRMLRLLVVAFFCASLRIST